MENFNIFINYGNHSKLSINSDTLSLSVIKYYFFWLNHWRTKMKLWRPAVPIVSGLYCVMDRHEWLLRTPEKAETGPYYIFLYKLPANK